MFRNNLYSRRGNISIADINVDSNNPKNNQITASDCPTFSKNTARGNSNNLNEGHTQFKCNIENINNTKLKHYNKILNSIKIIKKETIERKY